MKTTIQAGLILAGWILASGLGRESAAGAADWATTGDPGLDAYFADETARLEARCLADIPEPGEWENWSRRHRRQLYEMLGLDPLPERSDLKAVVTGRHEEEDFAVENLHFQSMPGLYVTANLYLPKPWAGPVPAVLYGSGHGPTVKDGISYGNKVSYQHHGIWFARNGYACLVLDTIQMGEIEGIHHGTYREGMWWWNSRGYTSAGVEAWNCIRALDYLSGRDEVDAERMGVTGRSGGGAYSWWVAALDERIKVAAPVAGITDLENHVVDGTVEGHCDCMFTVNTYRWDYPQVAALVAPRALLIVNTDADSIFPLDGVVRTQAKVRRVYEALGAGERLGLVIAPGPHKDTQDLRVPVFRWFNHYLKGEDGLIDKTAEKRFEPETLKVFGALPEEERSSRIHETFVDAAPTPPVPEKADDWGALRSGWMEALREKSFGGWPQEGQPLNLRRVVGTRRHGLRFEAYEFDSQDRVRLRLYRISPEGSGETGPVRVTILGDGIRASQYVPGGAEKVGELEVDRDEGGLPTYADWLSTMLGGFDSELEAERSREEALSGEVRADGPAFEAWASEMGSGMGARIYVVPRGLGLTSWGSSVRKQIQIRRRFMLLGQTLEGMRVWDIRRAMQAIRALAGARMGEVLLEARGDQACNLIYASLFEPEDSNLHLEALPSSHRTGPDYLNVLRILDVPQALAMAVERSRVELSRGPAGHWGFPVETAARLGWPATRLVIRAD